MPTKKEMMKSFFFVWQAQRMKKKGLRRFVLGILILPLVYFALLGSNSSNLNSWKLQISHWIGSGDASNILLLQELVTGANRRELHENGATCVSHPNSDICVATGEVRLDAKSSTFYLTGGQRLHQSPATVKPYPRKRDLFAMSLVTEVRLEEVEHPSSAPPCQFHHTAPAMAFSTAGYAGNFYHDMNDLVLSLFITSGHFRSRVHLVVVNLANYWVIKYRKILSHLSAHALIASGGGVHCFPGAVVGLKYHNHLDCNASDVPGGRTIVDFKAFLRESFSLKHPRVVVANGDDRPPSLVLVSRSKNRVLLNEGEVVRVAEEVGFRVTVADRGLTSRVGGFAEVVNSCEVMVGVHGAGLANFLFLPRDAVLVQVVPWGLDWVSETYYAVPSKKMGIRYLEYKTGVEESTLYDQYPKDHPVLADPFSIHSQGYNVSRLLYTEKQNVTLNVSRFRETLMLALQVLRNGQ
ncbi:hypothetical protein QJS10_CPB14g00580 [Acorus calamus]|uniref:Glycosyltransferase 61 catalytic domain-containing protein n=1 Tax=Acorus calamus TaxID=4465 RepID=A0AAV9D918_ACOCL|nr:hypothetical protein QJS10_CPB14g00580 [Acorus calamus]